MKRAPIILALAAAVFSLAISCRSVPERSIIGDHIPDSIKRAAKNAPRDAFVGIGNASLPNINLARTVAQTRARAEISRQLQTVVRDMVADFAVAAGTETQAALIFQENITMVLSESRLYGAVIVSEEQTADGQYWMVVVLPRSNVAAEILSAAESSARLVPGVNAAMWATDRMNRAMDRQSLADIAVAGGD